jgi:hypothetical protein
MAAMALSVVPKAVTTIGIVSGETSRAARIRSSPVFPGICMSVIRTSTSSASS